MVMMMNMQLRSRRVAANATSHDAAREMCDGNVVERRSKTKQKKEKGKRRKANAVLCSSVNCVRPVWYRNAI